MGHDRKNVRLRGQTPGTRGILALVTGFAPQNAGQRRRSYNVPASLTSSLVISESGRDRLQFNHHAAQRCGPCGTHVLDPSFDASLITAA
ncbi:hypothetical protein BQ8794_180001 [Mesorhizobium prunaredense]|uniref:Uncharacterized protein n=1 Tax=Mesorhizobium prunaredense TaxID=1631249 RepID=A0A1R3V460_9HYPH|nr:hypothetical protein BQ8794_180001 [Mesorhizobium prunaredense]